MAGQTERGLMAERLAVLAIWLGLATMLGGVGVLGMVALGGGAVALVEPSGALLAGVVLTVLGLGLALRGVALRLAAETLANVRLLQAETHRARTQAAIHSHAVREPMGPIRSTAEVEAQAEQRKPVPVGAISSAAPVTPKAIVKVVTSDTPMPTIARPGTQPERKASQKAPITGKPFQPHPIFMARPPR